MTARKTQVLATLIAAALALAAGALVPLATMPPVHAGVNVTPVPGRHSEVRALYFFYVKDTPDQQGWRAAEFKDEGGQSYYKADVAPGCGEWVVAPGTWPGLLLTPGGTSCTGFTIEFGVLYWFDVPPIKVTPSPFPTPPTATVTVGPTATPSPSPTVASGATSTPSVPTSTPTPGTIPTLSPAQKRAFTVYCDLSGLPYTMTIWGNYALTYSVPDGWCQPSRDGAQELLRRMAEVTPARVEIRP